MNAPSTNACRIVIIVAGTNDPSNSRMLTERFSEGAAEAGVESTFIRLKDVQIDHFSLDCYDSRCTINDQFPRVRDAILSADGLVFASPIWNFSVPAHLKNLIDRMGAFGLDAGTHSVGTMEGKPTFLLLTGGAPKAAWPLLKRTTSHVGIGLQYFGCSVVGTHFEGSCTSGRGKFGLIVDKRPASLAAMQKEGAAFASIVRTFKETGQLPVWYRMKKSALKTVQKIKRKLGL